MKPGNQSDIVKEFGVSRNAISLLVKNKDHRIIYTPSGKIDIDATIEALRKSDFGARSRKLKSSSKTKEPINKSDLSREEYSDDIDTGGPLKLTDDRSRIELHKAFHQSEKERINNEIKLQDLIPVNEVGDRSFNLWRQVRDHLQNQKDRISLKLQASESAHDIEQILNEDNHTGLESIISEYQDLDDDGLKKKLVQRLI